MTPDRTPRRPPSPPHAPRAVASARRAQAEAFRQGFLLAVLAALFAVAAPLRAQPAATDTPERERPVGTPQAVGTVHTLRQIPEACTRLEGVFTGEAAAPYRMQAVPLPAPCQPRARYADAGPAQASVEAGWILNDVIRVPDQACPSRQAVVRVWRKPAAAAAPARDGQGQARVYLEDAKRQAAAGTVAALPQFAAAMELKGGGGCR